MDLGSEPWRAERVWHRHRSFRLRGTKRRLRGRLLTQGPMQLEPSGSQARRLLVLSLAWLVAREADVSSLIQDGVGAGRAAVGGLREFLRLPERALEGGAYLFSELRRWLCLIAGCDLRWARGVSNRVIRDFELWQERTGIMLPGRSKSCGTTMTGTRS